MGASVSQPVKPWLRLRRGLEHDYQVLKVREDRWADPRTGREHPRVRVECAYPWPCFHPKVDF